MWPGSKNQIFDPGMFNFNKIKMIKQKIKKYGKRAFVIYIIWCTAKGIAFLALGKYLIS